MRVVPGGYRPRYTHRCGGKDDEQVSSAGTNDFSVGSENADEGTAEQISDDDEWDATEEPQNEGLGDDSVPAYSGSATGVLARKRNRPGAKAQPDPERELGVEISDADSGDRGGREQARDEDVDRSHQSVEKLLNGDRPPERRRSPPDAPRLLSYANHSREEL